MRRNVDKDDAGFTLIELAVVIIIIGVLVAVAVPTYLRLTETSHDAAAQTEVRLAAEAAVLVLSEDPTVVDLAAGMRALSPTISFDPLGTDGIRLDRAADNAACVWRVSQSNTVWVIWMSTTASDIRYAQLPGLATCPTAIDAPGAGFSPSW